MPSDDTSAAARMEPRAAGTPYPAGSIDALLFLAADAFEAMALRDDWPRFNRLECMEAMRPAVAKLAAENEALRRERNELAKKLSVYERIGREFPRTIASLSLRSAAIASRGQEENTFTKKEEANAE